MPILQLQDLRPGEKIEIVMRRHWFTLVHTVVYIFLLIISALYLFAFRDSFETIGISSGAIGLLLIFYISIFSLFIFVDWLSNELDFFIFTNKRLIGIEQISFLNRVLSECSLDRVQEVNGFSKRSSCEYFQFRYGDYPYRFGKIRIRNAYDCRTTRKRTKNPQYCPGK